MEHNFEAQLRNNRAERAQQTAERAELAYQKFKPILDEATPRYLDARQAKGPDSSWDEIYSEDGKQIGFSLYHGYEDRVYLAGNGELYWSPDDHGSEIEPLCQLGRPTNDDEVQRLRAVTLTLLQGGNWESDPELQSELIATVQS